MGALDYFDWCAIAVLFGVIKLLVLEVKNLELRRPLTLFTAAGKTHEAPPHSLLNFQPKNQTQGPGVRTLLNCMERETFSFLSVGF